MSKEESKQELQIKEARAILDPSPVKAGSYPRWFTSAVRKACKPERRNYFYVDDAVRKWEGSSGTWWDHAGRTTYFGRECVVSEPYHITTETLASVEQFCKDTGLDYQVVANSWHYPGHTLRILFFIPPLFPPRLG